MSPCTDGGPTDEQRQEPRRLRACLCGILTVVERDGNIDTLLGAIDWGEAGVTEEWLRGWWAEHKAADVKRKMREADDRRRQEIARAGLKKLTAEERAALGIRTGGDR